MGCAIAVGETLMLGWKCVEFGGCRCRFAQMQWGCPVVMGVVDVQGGKKMEKEGSKLEGQVHY